MRIRPATRADLVAFYGRPPSMTVRALVAVDADDRPVGVGGYYLKDGTAVAFSDQVGMNKRDMVRAGRPLMAMLKRLGMTIVAASDTTEATALRHFGFAPAGALWRLD